MQFIEFLISQLFPKPPFKNSIRPNRIKKEQEICQSLQLNWISNSNIDIIEFDSQGCRTQIKLNELYPFSQPQLRFQLDDDFYSIKNLNDYNQYDYYYKVLKWTPQLTVNQIIEKSHEFIKKNIFIKQPYTLDPYSDLLSKITKSSKSLDLSIIFIFLLISLSNLILYLPNYEEQQQLMERTVLFGQNTWYNQFQQLPLSPLKAQFYCLIGLIVNVFDSSKLHVFKQQQEQINQPFFHYLNLIINLLIFYCPLYFLLKSKQFKINKEILQGILLYQIICPTFLGIWNIIEILMALCIFIIAENVWFGSILYVIAVNYEPQCLLLYPIISTYCLGRLCQQHGIITKKNIKPNFQGLQELVIELIFLILVLIIVQCFILIPFYFSSSLSQAIYPSTFINYFNSLFNHEFYNFIIFGFAFIFSFPALMLSFLNDKYCALGVFNVIIIIKLFDIANGITTQMLSVFLMLNFKYFRQIINYIIILMPQQNWIFKLLYYIFGDLFMQRNNQLIDTHKHGQYQFQSLRKLGFYILLLSQIMYIYDLEMIMYKICLVILLINCLFIIQQKIVKVMKKAKTD
ncbi:unnamed protein product [Paramecium primaurelia]|uniref:Transmembrane protein n=1 Tax=Paramecium primaurelia TaxID=5886 RepID=A0A8S1MU16_PARPR|nr:unnamed protein product [Paramecium primaurelia]